MIDYTFIHQFSLIKPIFNHSKLKYSPTINNQNFNVQQKKSTFKIQHSKFNILNCKSPI
jgi:hypothetical protein